MWERSITEAKSISSPKWGGTYSISIIQKCCIHFNSTYPPGCLVFLRNVHPETNKTTLRGLFLHARRPIGIEVGKKDDDDGLDYLDYTKGMDSVCVLFLFIRQFFKSNNKLTTVLCPIAYSLASATTRSVPLFHPNRLSIRTRRFRCPFSSALVLVVRKRRLTNHC